MMKTSYLHIFALLFAAVFMAACSDEPDNTADGEPVTAVFAVSSRAQQPVLANELMQSWWVMMVRGGEICGVAESGALADAVESDEFEMKLNRGRYTAYGFANISRADLEALFGCSFAKGERLPAGFDAKTYELGGASFAAGTMIPMSGSREVEVTGRAGERIAVEVVRMMGKVEFEFSNGSGDDVEVLGVSFGPLYTGAVDLLPASDPAAAPVIKADAVASTPFVEFTGASLAATGSEAVLRHFYVRETSAAAHPTGVYHFSVRLRRNGNVVDELYALTSDLTHICRNDYIQIPVAFIDWVLKFNVEFYPPIGGYPAMIVEERNSEYYIRFGSSGLFVMNPDVRRASDNTPVAPKDLIINVLEVDDPSGIISGDLRIEDGQIFGNLADRSGIAGTARVQVSIAVSNPGGPSRAFIRNFYVIR